MWPHASRRPPPLSGYGRCWASGGQVAGEEVAGEQAFARRLCLAKNLGLVLCRNDAAGAAALFGMRPPEDTSPVQASPVGDDRDSAANRDDASCWFHARQHLENRNAVNLVFRFSHNQPRLTDRISVVRFSHGLSNNRNMDDKLDFVWLREELKKPGRSQTDLAKHMGLHVSAVNKILNGSRALKLSEYRKILEYLGADLADGLTELQRYQDDKLRLQIISPTSEELADAEWVITRSATTPPGSMQGLEGRLLSDLVDEDQSAVLWSCWAAIFDELSRTIILHMEGYNDRHASRLFEYLKDQQLAILLGRGLSLLTEDDARQLSALVAAISSVGKTDEGERMAQNLRRAASAATLDSMDKVRAKLVRFTADLCGLLIKAQQGRIETVKETLSMPNMLKSRLEEVARARNDLKSKNQIDV